MSHKICKNCGEEKPSSFFWKDSKYLTLGDKDGLRIYCISCDKKIRDTDHRREYAKVWSRNYRKRNPDKARWASIKHRHGLTKEEWQMMFDKQLGCCAICGKHQSEVKRRLVVDHCHKTGKIRKLLCDLCNTRLGWYENHQAIIDDYVEL
jgi:hypothetical protein